MERMDQEAQFYIEVSSELIRARYKFPEGKHLLAALFEEAGEVANALLERDYLVNRYSPEEHNRHVWNECVQTAAMALRLATEGDPEFQYRPPEEEKMKEIKR